MAYNIPNEAGLFDVYLTALSCDGQTVVEPHQILALEGVNQTTPRITAYQDHILVASQGDDGTGTDNLSIHKYSYTLF